MKTKKEVLEYFIKHGNCGEIYCSECPYQCSGGLFNMTTKLIKLGAEVELTYLLEHREFDPSRILTTLTADQAKVGQKGYFADDIVTLKNRFDVEDVRELTRIYDETSLYRFQSERTSPSLLAKHMDFALFYPLED